MFFYIQQLVMYKHYIFTRWTSQICLWRIMPTWGKWAGSR